MWSRRSTTASRGLHRWRIDASDVNPIALQTSLAGRGATLLYDVFDLYPDLLGAYDVLFLLDVIEHIEEPKPFLEAALRHLKPGGIVIANVPALQRYFSVFDEVLGHYRRYDARSLVGEFRDLPIEPIDVRYWGFTLLPVLWARTLWMKRHDPSQSAQVARSGVLPPNKLANGFLTSLMKLETTLSARPWLGTSVLLAARWLPDPHPS